MPVIRSAASFAAGARTGVIDIHRRLKGSNITVAVLEYFATSSIGVTIVPVGSLSAQPQRALKSAVA